MKNQPFHRRLGFALSGLRECWRTERSFRTQSAAGLLALATLPVLRPAPVWWALVALAVMLVLALELVNSAFERLIDHLHPEREHEIGLIKDMAAGGVLLLSFGALAVAGAMAATLVTG